MASMITVNNLSKRYGKTLAVSDLSFTVPQGHVTGFLGPNGSGKSTTMRCMLGLDSLSGGDVIFETEDYRGEFAQAPNKTKLAGALLDANWFDPGRKGRAHLRAIARGAGIPDARVEECLELVGLTKAANRRVGGYSLGMKQRLGIAMALLGDPEHLIFDEPVNGLDPEGVSWVRNTVRMLASQGKAVLVSSHLLSEMQVTADRLVVIGRGKMIGEYTMQDFLADGTRVIVESQHLDAIAGALREQGITSGMVPGAHGEPPTLEVQVPSGAHEAEVRSRVASAALGLGVEVTRLMTRNASLEERFLDSTRDATEYASDQTAVRQGAQQARRKASAGAQRRQP